jgi:archaellum biogenesis ATPase FlaH
MQTNLLDQALMYLALGWSIVPVAMGSKKPLIPWGRYQHEMPTEDKVGEWFRNKESNIGIVTGAVSGLVVLDVDVPGVSYNIDTPTVQTSRGYHYYFAYPPGATRINAVIQGLGELKGDGGLVIAPPSLHEGGRHRYTWIVPAGRPLAQLPERFLRLAGKKSAAEADLICEGERNATLASKAGTLRRAGMDEEDIAACLRAINLEQCSPPLDEREVDSIARSISRYPSGPREPEPDVREEAAPSLFGVAPGIADWLNTPAPDPDWLVDGMLHRHTTNMLDGLGGSGKSVLVNQLTLSLATGTPFLGLPTRESRVLVLNVEDPSNENHRRVRAVANAYRYDGVSEEKLRTGEDNVTFVSFQDLTVSPALRDKGNPTQTFEEICAFVNAWKPDLVVLDPLVYFYGGDENSTAEAIAFFTLLRQLRTTVLLVHHQNKDAQKTGSIKTAARGSIVFIDQARTRMVLGDNQLQIAKINYRAPYTLNLTFKSGIWSLAKRTAQRSGGGERDDD